MKRSRKNERVVLRIQLKSHPLNNDTHVSRMKRLLPHAMHRWIELTKKKTIQVSHTVNKLTEFRQQSIDSLSRCRLLHILSHLLRGLGGFQNVIKGALAMDKNLGIMDIRLTFSIGFLNHFPFSILKAHQTRSMVNHKKKRCKRARKGRVW